MDEKQNQNIKDNSIGLQAGNNIIIQGMTYNDVKEIFYDLFNANFPKIQEIARKEADKRIELLLQTFFNELINNKDAIDINKFSSPNIQYEISQLTINVARYGNTDNFYLLSKLLTQQLNTKTTSALNQMVSECLSIIPKLSKQQLYILVLQIIVKKIGYTEKDIKDYDKHLKTYDEYINYLINQSSDSTNIAQNIHYLKLINCLISAPTNPDNIYSYIKKQLSIKKTNDDLDIMKLLEDKELYNIKKLLELSRTYTCLSHELSLIGELIGSYLLSL